MFLNVFFFLFFFFRKRCFSKIIFYLFKYIFDFSLELSLKFKTQKQSTLKLAHKINDCWSWQACWKTRTLLAFSFGKASKLLPVFDIRSKS